MYVEAYTYAALSDVVLVLQPACLCKLRGV